MIIIGKKYFGNTIGQFFVFGMKIQVNLGQCFVFKMKIHGRK